MSHSESSQTNSTVEHTPTAAVILIGNELLSGRTQDTNLAYIAKGLASHGIKVTEARVISDDAAVIESTVNHLRSHHTYVFTTGGIGPTHDDITADCIAAAFNVALPINPEAEACLQAYWAKKGVESNPDRLRMARIPEGAELIDNPVSAAPGFKMHNVYVMAGVPRIMQGMFDGILPTLQRGLSIHSVSVVCCNLGEGLIASPLRALQQAYPELELGSYPGQLADASSVTLIARGTNQEQLESVKREIQQMVVDNGGTVGD